jgi:NAD(P)-dependent dehydrogenase (short-subunit alcohol dehydrogenase family)
MTLQIINNRLLYSRTPTSIHFLSVTIFHINFRTMASVIRSQKTALITGAASGVGFAVAKLCRNKGMHLALLDIDENNLTKAKTTLGDLDPSLKTEIYVLDVADRSAWKEIAGKISGSFPEIDLVVLNAGRGYKPQAQEGRGRLNPWLDTEYWSKVSTGSSQKANK